MMVRLLAVACVWAFSAAEPAAVPTPRSLTAIRTDVSEALRAEATTRRTGDNAPQVLRLVDLYLEMAAHPKRDSSPLLNDLGQQVRLRLQSVRERIERRIADKKPSAMKNSKPATVAAKQENRVLAQQVPLAGGAQGRAAAGGRSLVVTGTQAIAAGQADFGPDLVALIEATISPATWKINGGNGAIVYFAPLHVLVVSAPDEVHAQIGGVLRQLQAAQKQQDGAQVVVDVVAGRAGE